VKDSQCVEFLQWALPQRRLRWPGYRKVRGTVCKRLNTRLAALGLPDPKAYQRYVVTHPQEWAMFDALCPITISSFYRDKGAFEFLAARVLPEVVQAGVARGAKVLRAWSVGCASGEEPYTLSIVWRMGLAETPRLPLSVLGTDIDDAVLARARGACYPPSSLKHLPGDWVAQGFEKENSGFCLREEFREGVMFEWQDVREVLPAAHFDLILCRNLVFTYFEESLQRATLARLLTRLLRGGVFVIGRHESLPADVEGLETWPGGETLGVFRRC
jgi:chemotaxis protein methyltransferase CheR